MNPSKLPRSSPAIRALGVVLIFAASVAACSSEEAAGPAPGETLRWDFEDGDTGGWTGFNSAVRVSSERAHEGRRALRVDSGQWGANLTLQSPELARARKMSLSVWCELAEGKSAAWPQLHVDNVNTSLWVGPGEGGRLAGGRWESIEIDLTPYEHPQSITIQVWDAARLYVDDVSAELLAARPVQTRRIRVTIDPGRILHEFAPDGHGTNLVALWNDTGDSAGAVRAFSQLGLGLMRFPGGVPAQWYDWKDPLATGWTELTPERAWKMARAGGARMIFQTNAATKDEGVNKTTGTSYELDNSPEHQAAWASFCRERGIDVAFWEIGNEPEMDAPEALKASQSAVYDWYNEVFAKQARAIKAVDPEARVLGPASTNTWFWWHEGNLARFLRAHGDREGTGLVDGVSLHWYPGGGDGPWEKKRGEAQGWADCMKFIRRVIRDHDTRDLPLYVTEWNWGGGENNISARKLSNALGVADVVGMFLRTGVAGHAHFCLQKIDRNWGILAMQNDSRPPDHPSPTYFALVLAARLHGRILDVTSDADSRNVLSVYGAETADGTVRILLINKSGERIEAGLSLADRTSVTVQTVVGINGGIDDEEVVFNGVASPNPAQDDLPPASTREPADTWMLPPYSITLLSYS